MKIIKKFILILICPILLFMVISYGIGIIFGNFNLTFIEIKTISNEQYYYFNTIEYVKQITSIQNSNILQNWINGWVGAWTTAQRFTSIWGNGYNFGDLTKTILCALAVISSLCTQLIINTPLMIIQLIIELFGAILHIVGINTNNTFFQPFIWFKNYAQIPTNWNLPI